MKDPVDPVARSDIDHFFENPRIQGALSTLGVFAIDFSRQRALPSSLWTLCGYGAQEMTEGLFSSLLHPDDQAEVTAHLEALFQGREDTFEGVFRMKRRDGSWIWISGRYTVVYRRSDGTPLLYLGLDRDVTAIKEAEEEKKRRLEEIETLRQVIADVNGSLDLNETVDLILNHTRRVIPYDKCSVQLLSEGELQIIGCTGFADREKIMMVRFPFPDTTNPGSAAIQSRTTLVCNDLESEYPGFQKVKDQDRTRSWLGIPLIANNEVIGLLALDSLQRGFYTDRHRELAEFFAGHVALAVEKARMFEGVRAMALTDHLTGAGNRHALQLQGPFFLEKAKREHRAILALMVDIDRFKGVNDTYGHDRGDLLLRETAEVIRAGLRGYDLFFRYGGEEFLILLPDTEREVAWEIAERIRRSMENTPRARLDPGPTVSIGLGSLVPSASMTLSDLIKLADLALYEAKNTGRNRTVCRELSPQDS